MDPYCPGIKSVRRVVALAGDPILHQGLLQSHGPGIRGGMKTEIMPPCYPKHEPKVLLQKKLKVVLRWFRYLKAGVVIFVLR